MLALLSAAGNVSAQTAPDMSVEVARVTAADPARFACAHSGRSCEADWIKAVAWALHQIDTRWGLNAKRDGPATDLSLDVVTYRIGPTDRHVLAFDICGACGSSVARPVWSDITNRATVGQPGTARWVKPEPVDGASSGGGGAPPTTAPPAPVPGRDYTADLAAIVAKIDAVAALVLAARDAALNAERDTQLLLNRPAPPVPILSIPCLVGRVPKTFGGSTVVTFCPVE